MKIIPTKTLLFSILLTSCSFATAAPVFNIDINFTGGLTSSQQATITQSANFWNNLIYGYQPKISTEFSGFTVNIGAADIDGYSGTLAQAGTSSISNNLTGGYTLSSGGSITFDSYDIGSLEYQDTLFQTSAHEIGHILGIGSLWEENGLYINNSGEYTGVASLAAYQTEFDSTATFVPVELDHGPGTANSHWNEAMNGLTGITNSDGYDMNYELMTGSADDDVFLSDTTIASLTDLGYNVSAVPVPTAIWLFTSALGLLAIKSKSGMTV